MANPQGIVHPHLTQRLQATFYPSLCLIEQQVEAQDSYGAVTVTWATLAGHGALRCRVSPNRAVEIHDAQGIYTVHSWTINLAGYYPTITPKMRATVGGIVYDIETVQPDGNRQLTRLTVRIVE